MEQRSSTRNLVARSLAFGLGGSGAAAAMLLLATTLVAPTTVHAAQGTCYQDESGRIVNRRRPGFKRVPCPEAETDADGAPVEQRPGVLRPGQEVGSPDSPGSAVASARTRPPASIIPRPDPSDYPAMVPIPDRWRIIDALGPKVPWYDPYNRNVLKGDKPVHGEWFFSFLGIADSIYEVREVPTPIGTSSTNDAGGIDIFGRTDQAILATNLAMEFVYYKGDTVFRPPDWEIRFTPVFNFNYVEIDEILGLEAQPRRGDDRSDNHVGIQSLFVDKHLTNVSDRYDFDSLRVGIQPFSSDFRGFLFQDQPFGVRLFGTRRNNIFQYNLAWFRKHEKDTNSLLNDLAASLRNEDIFVANLYWQDLIMKGHTSQFSAYYHRSRDDDFHFDQNDFIQRPASIGEEKPRTFDVFYVGYNGDGHFGRLNLTTSIYGAFGEEDGSTFTSQDTDIEALFVAMEASIDYDWIRPRISFLYGSGDDDPFDDKSTGFDAIFENPQFAGADTSYWIRQPVPLIGGGRVTISNRNGVLNTLRSSKEEGLANFVNPGIWLLGAGVDIEVLPSLRVAANWNYLRFDTTEVLEVARNQADIDEEIGHDVSIVATYRPFATQNVVIRASYARLIPGQGFKDLFPDEDSDYFLLNVLLQF